MTDHPDHTKNLIALKRVEGQIRGIQKMIEDRKYCVNIMTQIHAAVGALIRVEDKILAKHFESCATKAIKGKSKRGREEKLTEILDLIHRFRKV
ncbi:MAG: metal-sensitive transcriptional regulator [Candidatus Omnitrophota bacterium]